MEIKEIKELLITIDKTSIHEFKLQKDNLKLEIIKFDKEDATQNTNEVSNVSLKIEQSESKVKSENMTINEDKNDFEDIYIVKSPIVGVFYASPSPDAEPFFYVGDIVTIGQSLCIIEAMKIMNEIESEINGEIIEMLVKNEDLVEYGQPLMKIRRK